MHTLQHITSKGVIRYEAHQATTEQAHNEMKRRLKTLTHIKGDRYDIIDRENTQTTTITI